MYETGCCVGMAPNWRSFEDRNREVDLFYEVMYIRLALEHYCCWQPLFCVSRDDWLQKVAPPLPFFEDD